MKSDLLAAVIQFCLFIETSNATITPTFNRSRAMRQAYIFLKNITVALIRPTAVPLTGVGYLLIKTPITAFRFRNLISWRSILRRLRYKFGAWGKDWRYNFKN